jgi:hypothetical protein
LERLLHRAGDDEWRGPTSAGVKLLSFEALRTAHAPREGARRLAYFAHEASGIAEFFRGTAQ